KALEAAAALEAEGISCEVIDPRTLVPFDYETVVASLKKTGKLLIVHEDNYTLGWGAQLAAYIAENEIFLLDAPIMRLATPDIPIPFSPPLENFVIPSKQRIMEAARKLARQ
ncbi:MAG: transketolase C-terminal domain-containing protein, partial [Oscillospiraceae bacterium]